MKKHYDEIIKQNRELVLKLDEEKDGKEKATQEMMTEHHLLGRRNTELLREIDEIKLKKYREIDVDFTEELRFAKVDFGEDIKAIMKEMHMLLIENKILKSKLNKSDFNIQNDTNLLKLKEELIKELYGMKKIYDKDHEEMRKDYDAVVRERKSLIVQVKEQKEQLLDDSNLISDLQMECKDNEVKNFYWLSSPIFSTRDRSAVLPYFDFIFPIYFQLKHEQWKRIVQTYQGNLARVVHSNKKSRKEIKRLNNKMNELESYIGQLKIAQDKNKDIEKELKEFQVWFYLDFFLYLFQ